jgi:uroporphyrinogen-III synthase
VRVWVTRTQPGADRLAESLSAAGHEPAVCPALTVVEVLGGSPRGPFADVVFLSEHAVRFGVPRLASESWFSAARKFAVGAATAEHLAAAGIGAGFPEQATSEGLLALPEFADGRGRAVLIVGGVGGRDVLEKTLTARGARVEKLAVYRRQAVEAVALDVDSVDAIAVASGDGFAAVARLWFAAGGCGDVPVLVPSRRVAGLGGGLGFSNVFTCAGAGADAVIEALESVSSTGR